MHSGKKVDLLFRSALSRMLMTSTFGCQTWWYGNVGDGLNDFFSSQEFVSEFHLSWLGEVQPRWVWGFLRGFGSGHQPGPTQQGVHSYYSSRSSHSFITLFTKKRTAVFVFKAWSAQIQKKWQKFRNGRCVIWMFRKWVGECNQNVLCACLL